MLCSKCSEKVRPVVALDIDGVLGDYHGHFLRFATSYFGYDLEKLLEMSLHKFDGGEKFSSYCGHWLNCTLQEYRDCKLAYRQGALKRSMPINNGAVTLTIAVRQEAELWITTTRPYLSLDGVVKDTIFWLDLYNIQYDGLLFDDDKYAVLAGRVDPARVVAVLDDVDEMYDAAESLFGEFAPILYLNGYNDAMRYDRRTTPDLGAARFSITERIDLWDREYV